MIELSTENVLHPRQVAEANERRDQLQEILSAPPHVRARLEDDGGKIRKQMIDNENFLKQAPKPFSPDEIDGAVKAETELREKWLAGMPTQAEMRKNPPGAVDKNMAWEARTKPDVLKWKNLCRRLHASEITENRLVDKGDISNIEMFRPVGGASELNMDNAQIPGTQYKLPPPGAAPGTVLSDDDIATVKEIDPGINLAALDNEGRAKVKQFIAGLSAPEINVDKRGKWTPERKAAASAKAKDAWVKRQAEAK